MLFLFWSDPCTLFPNSLVGKPLSEKNGNKNAGASSKAKEITPNPEAGGGKKPPSGSALAMHQKWQKAAEKLGGKDVRIVVSKPQAKKMIFDLRFDAVRPINITQIYTDLQAVVPLPVLNACLQDIMAPDKHKGKNPFADSDEDKDPKDFK